MGNVFMFLGGLLVGILGTLGNQTSKEIGAFFKGITNWFKDIWSKIKDAFEPIVSLVNRVVSTIKSIFDRIANFNPLGAVANAVTQSPIGQAVSGVVESVKDSPVGKAVGSVVDKVKDSPLGIINKMTGGTTTNGIANTENKTLPQTNVTNNKQASSTFAPVVNVLISAGDNVANEVVSALEQMYSRTQQAYIG